jgi:hypothetical protein
MINVTAGYEFQANVSGFNVGLTGSVGVQIFDSLGNIVAPRSIAGVIEVPLGSGNYVATLVAPLIAGNYLVFWDEGTVTPQTSSAETLAVAAAVAAVVDPKLIWLRRLTADLAVTESDLLTAPGVSTEFFVTNPPMVRTPRVTVAGSSMVTPGDFNFTRYSIIFTQAPARGQMVTIRYARTTFGDTELEGYLAAAAEEFTATRHLVYKAAIYAIDTLLVGFGAAFDFGSGQENFQFSAAFQHLVALRGTWESWLEKNAENGLEIYSMNFDSQDPTFPGTFDPNQLDYGSTTVTGSPPGYPGAFQL